MEENKIKVYAKLDENNNIININSSIFLDNVENYICIDEGYGDRYAHAQGNYLEGGLFDDTGKFNYKYIENKIIKLSDEEKKSLFPDTAMQTDDSEDLKAELNDLKEDSAAIMYALMKGGLL